MEILRTVFKIIAKTYSLLYVDTVVVCNHLQTGLISGSMMLTKLHIKSYQSESLIRRGSRLRKIVTIEQAPGVKRLLRNTSLSTVVKIPFKNSCIRIHVRMTSKI